MIFSSNYLGFTRARFTVSDLARARREEINFLVDGGSRFVIFDQALAQKLRLKTLTKVKLMMADKRHRGYYQDQDIQSRVPRQGHRPP